MPRRDYGEDSRGRPSALSDAHSNQLAKIVKHYIRIGISLCQETILSMAKNFYRDEHNADPSDKTFGSAWFYRFLNRNGISTSLYNPQDVLRLNAATEHNVSNFFQRVARTVVSNGGATGVTDGDLNVLKQLILDKQHELMKNVVTTTRKRRNTFRVAFGAMNIS